jgi:O-antigen/teichoic acid export membrane protein
MSIFTVLCTLEISGSAIYKGFATFDGKRSDDFITAAVGAEMLLTLISFAVYIIFRKEINGLSGLGNVLPAVLIAHVFSNTVTGIFIGGQRYKGNFKTVALINGIEGLLSPPFGLLLINLGIRKTGRIYGQLAVSAVIAFILLIKIIKRSGRLFSGKVWKYLFRLLIPMLPHYIGSSILAQSDKIIVAKILGDGAVGKYAAAFSFGHLPSLFTGGIALAMTPYMIRRIKSGDRRGVEERARKVIRFGALTILAFLTALPELFRFFVSEEYYSALPAAYLTALGVLFSFSVTLTNTALLYYSRSIVITKNTLLAAALTLPSSYFLTVLLGYVAAAAVSAASYALLLFLSCKSLERHAPREMLNVNNYLPIYWFTLGAAALIFVLRVSLLARALLFLAISLVLCLDVRQTLVSKKINKS